MYNGENVHSPEVDEVRGTFDEMFTNAADKIKPMIGEQLLREYILGVGDTNEILNIYCSAFGIDRDSEVRLVILKPFDAVGFDDFFFVKNTLQQYIGGNNILASVIIHDFVFAITTLSDRELLTEMLEKTSAVVRQCYKCSLLSVYSDTTEISELPAEFDRLKVCLGYAFYSGENKVVYEKDIKINSGDIVLRPDYGAIEHAVKSGDTEKVKILMSAFFKKLRSVMPTPAVAKTYCLELYVCIIRCCEVDKIERYMKGILYVQESRMVSAIQDFIEGTALEIAELNAPEADKIYSSLIRDTINIIDENIENEHLSLRWLAGTILYTNVDYLGKLFKKETGKNFSHYVMEKRMEMAKTLISEGRMDRIYEVAENVGYGSNSQYFSQVFKKYTGLSPLEYKEFSRIEREKQAQ